MRKKLTLGHGSGGKLMNELINNLIIKIFDMDEITIDDSYIYTPQAKKLAFTTDTFTVSPIFFPGGDIGKLAINGTINDLSVMGAVPKIISVGLVIEEGFEISNLEKILKSMKSAADIGKVKIVTGDTKIVEQGKVDKIFINTSGIGEFIYEIQRKPIQIGDKIIINGTIGDHGVSVMAKRNNFSFVKELQSDCAPLNHLILDIVKKFPVSIKFMRDPTRGGVASVLNEIVKDKPFGIKIYEEDLPVKGEVKGVSEILGIDPLYIANEGKVLMIVESKNAENIVKELRKSENGKDTKIIGEVIDTFPGKVYIETMVGGKRLLPLLIDEQLPRIC
ncbi:MAG TPA: hydrogenase expression/formation protein HypE [Candidatus Atribacteria bacterium]|nr:hydrogenase expression/formation protein HypE [Candidatus Atribacteria bacterium]